MNISDTVLPLVSVGIPTHDRPEGLRRTLECITKQTYTNLEIIVSDNASLAPEVENIVRDFARKDKRISFYRQEINQGAAFNFNFVLNQAHGKYFMWAADDDRWAVSFISRCIQELDSNPNLILCSTAAILIDQDEQELEEYFEDVNTVGMKRSERARKVLRNLARNTSFYGLYPLTSLRQIQIPKWYGGDHIFMTELSLRGEFVSLPDPLFYSMSGGEGTSVERVARSLGIHSCFLENFPNLSLFSKFLTESIRWKNITFLEHIQLTLYIINRFITTPYPQRIALDNKIFWRKLVDSVVATFFKPVKKTVKRLIS